MIGQGLMIKFFADCVFNSILKFELGAFPMKVELHLMSLIDIKYFTITLLIIT